MKVMIPELCPGMEFREPQGMPEIEDVLGLCFDGLENMDIDAVLVNIPS